jgi:serine/threonine-protein kinase HipA
VLWENSSAAEEDVRRFADSLILSWLLAATDAHAKNYSLLIAPHHEVRLAPLYDVISSLPYPRQVQPRKASLAMKIGSKYRVYDVARRHWETCAREMRLPPEDLLARVEEMIERLPAAAETVAQNMLAGGIDDPVVSKLVEVIAVHCQQCREHLG